MAEKTVTLVSKDGTIELELPVSDAVEITNKRAAGWSTKAEQKVVAKAAAKAEAAE